ncbi:MAG: hypothetical protein HC904_08345 [Blastochloris sp.]|nr:hypothetical protein [Blastochloris sp.]
MASVAKIFTEQRRYGALWASFSFAEGGLAGMEGSLVPLFIKETLLQRLRERNPTGSLESLSAVDGWSLDLSDGENPRVMESRLVPRGQEEKFHWFVNQKLATELAAAVRGKIP